MQDKPKEKHAKTHTNQTNKGRILKAAQDSSHPDWRVMVPHCGFDLHFSDNE